MIRQAAEATVSVTEGFDQAAWPGGDGLYQRSDWIAVMHSRIGPAPVTVVARDGRGAAALLAFEQRDPDGYEAYNLGMLLAAQTPVFPLGEVAERSRAALLARHPELRRAVFPDLAAAVPGYGSPLVGTPDLGGRALVARVLDAFVAAARERSARACALLYLPAEDPSLELLWERGFRRFPLTERAVLRLPPGGLDGYLAAQSPRCRRNIRREQRLLAGHGVRTRTLSGPGDWDHVLRLRCAHLAALGYVPDQAAEAARLEALRANFSAGLDVLITECAGRPVASTVMLRHGTTVHGVMVSVDKPNAPQFTVFEAAYYAAIRHLDGTGVTALDLGIGHLEAKTARGARLRRLDGWVLPLDPALDAALSEAAALMTESETGGSRT
jgi:uncharacterized protein